MAAVAGHESRHVIVRLAAEWDTPATRAFCTRLEEAARTAPAEAVLHRGRNLIFRGAVGHELVAVKRFPVVGARRLLYRVRSGKAVRAFDHATRLVSLAIGTPRPLAVVELRRGGAPMAAFYCCAFLPSFQEARALKRPDLENRTRLLERLGEFIGGVHERAVLHRDLTSGNVLIVPDPGREGGVSFALVDLNRMRFGAVGMRRGIANLAQLRLSDGGVLLSAYCRARGLAPDDVAGWYRLCLAVRSARQDIKERTRPLRRRLGL